MWKIFEETLLCLIVVMMNIKVSVTKQEKISIMFFFFGGFRKSEGKKPLCNKNRQKSFLSKSKEQITFKVK